MSAFWLVFAVLVWGLVHSYTASIKAKEWVRSALGDAGMRYYRLAYNMFSLLSVAPVLWLMAILPDKGLYQIPAPWVYLSLAGQVAAVILLVAGVMHTDPLSFVGLRQLIDGKELPSRLVTHGLYRWVRHPLYTSGLVFIWLTPIVSQNSLIVMVAATVYIVVGALFEERKLEREFGPVYAEYKSKTPMLVPGLKVGWNK